MTTPVAYSTSDVIEIIEALIKTFAFDPFWRPSPIAHVCREIAKERGGKLGARVIAEDDAEAQKAIERMREKEREANRYMEEREAEERAYYQLLKSKYEGGE